MDKTVTFKNGKTIQIHQDLANILLTRITNGCYQFQCYEDIDGDCDLVINISEIVCIE